MNRIIIHFLWICLKLYSFINTCVAYLSGICFCLAILSLFLIPFDIHLPEWTKYMFGFGYFGIIPIGFRAFVLLSVKKKVSLGTKAFTEVLYEYFHSIGFYVSVILLLGMAALNICVHKPMVPYVTLITIYVLNTFFVYSELLETVDPTRY